MTRSRQTADWGSRAGLAKVIPSSVAVGSGTGSADSLGNVTFSGASTVSLNDVFSVTYDNYKIIISLTAQTGGSTDLALRLRVSGSDNSTGGNYRWSGSYVASNGSSITGIFSGASDTTFRVATIDQQSFCELTIFNPFATQETSFISNAIDMNSTPVAFNSNRGGQMTVTTSYTGFTLINAGGGTITGTVRVYGYTQ